LPNNAQLTKEVQACSEQRAQAKLFTVAIDFWEDISQKIRDNEVLLDKYTSTSDAAKLLLEQSKDYYNEGKYRLVIQCLEQPRISLDDLSPKQKATRLRLLALSYAHLGELAKIEDYLQQAIGLESYSEETFKARIMIELLKHNSTVAEELNNEAKAIYPDESSFYIFELLLKSDSDKPLPKFDALDQDLRNEDNVVQLYLSRYLTDKKFDEFNELYEQQNANKKMESAYSYLYLNAVHNQIILDDSLSDDKEKLQKAIQAFTPRTMKLWNIENAQMLSNVVTLLANSYTLLNELDEAYQTLRDFEEQGHQLNDKQLVMYFEVTATEKPDNLLCVINKSISRLNGELILHLYQIALKNDISSVVERLDEVIQASDDKAYIDAITALKWDTNFASDPKNTISSIVQSTILNSENVVALCLAGGVLYRFSQNHRMLIEISSRLKILLEQQNDVMNRRNITAYYLNTNSFEDAIPLLKESISSDNEKLRPKVKLALCYVETKRFREAKELLNSFPKSQLENNELRFQALRLAQLTHDWDYHEKLLAYEEKRFPEYARTWVLKLTLALRKSSEAELRKIVRDIPANLIGNPNDSSYLAQREIKYGKQDKALNRIYKMLRKDFNNPKARDAYINVILGQSINNYEIPTLTQTVKKVQVGSTIQFVDDLGSLGFLSIDIESGLPVLDGFISPDSELASNLNGKVLGDTFTVNTLGISRTYTIEKIESIYLRLFHRSMERLSDLSAGKSGLVSFKLDLDKDGIDSFLKVMTDDLEKRASETDNIFEQYKKHPFTIGMIAKLLGKESFDVLHNWPRRIEHCLIVSDGTQNDIESSRDVIAAGLSSVVVDGNTLIEIARNQMWKVFDGIETIYISSTTNEKINEWLYTQENSLQQQTGNIFYDGGLRITDVDKNQKQFVLDNIKAVRRFADSENCEIVAAYGEVEDNAIKLRVYDILSEDEFASLRLAKEKSCALLSFDARLRQFAIFDGIRTVQPNILYQHLHVSSVVSDRDYNVSMGIQFISNRWLYEDYPSDVFAWCCAQGEWQAKLTLQRMRSLISLIDSVEHAINMTLIKLFDSFSNVMTLTIGAYAEIVSYLITGLKTNPKYIESTHKKVLDDAIESISIYLADIHVKSMHVIFRNENRMTRYDKLLRRRQIRQYFANMIEERFSRPFNENELPNIGVVFGKMPEFFKK
jgi:transcription elongation GreA/GreB family factor